MKNNLKNHVAIAVFGTFLTTSSIQAEGFFAALFAALSGGFITCCTQRNCRERTILHYEFGNTGIKLGKSDADSLQNGLSSLLEQGFHKELSSLASVYTNFSQKEKALCGDTLKILHAAQIAKLPITLRDESTIPLISDDGFISDEAKQIFTYFLKTRKTRGYSDEIEITGVVTMEEFEETTGINVVTD